jgi:hypothetical protein
MEEAAKIAAEEEAARELERLKEKERQQQILLEK